MILRCSFGGSRTESLPKSHNKSEKQLHKSPREVWGLGFRARVGLRFMYLRFRDLWSIGEGFGLGLLGASYI